MTRADYPYKCDVCGRPIDTDDVSVSRAGEVETRCCGGWPIDPETGKDRCEEVMTLKAQHAEDARADEAYERWKDGQL